MSTFDLLTDDVIRCILQLQTKNATKCLSGWKSALPALAMCRRWRALAIPLVYSAIIIGDGPQIEQTYMPIDRCSIAALDSQNQKTNMRLLVDNGYIGSAKELVVSLTPDFHPIKVLSYLSDSLCQDNHDWSNIRTFKLTFCTTVFSYELLAMNEENDKQLAVQIAHNLASKVNRVQIFAARSMLDDDLLTAFTEVLGRRYFGELRDIYWMTHGTLGPECTTTQLTSCLLRHANDEHGLPLICPQKLKYLRIVPFLNAFSWLCFHFDKTSDDIVFENLRTLDLEDRRFGIRVPNSPPLSLENGKVPNIAFPRLNRLVFKSVTLTPEITRLFVASPLKSVAYDGLPSNILELRGLNISRLDMLSVRIWYGFTVSPPDFYACTNELFQETNSAKYTLLAVTIEETIIDAAQAYWPCLTHLDLCNEYLPNLALDLIPRAPNIVYLAVRAFKAGEHETEEKVQEYFDGLSQRYSQPLNSKITYVSLVFARGRLPLFDTLAIDLFTRCLPKLINITISD
ncbi:hypothetical protein IWW55_001152 [Coemansia sp. RSA 2706]|nr:hypothetical protein IWW55_001152 [Coemansia sp. RSA 2706]KAJ2319410.1 hypothetical protein IWW52_001985 [Coemansia sp. RSA 2704]KAJ2734991.1 hypothetical protein H4R23_002301 [Coemansia sp. Cherry 401B]